MDARLQIRLDSDSKRRAEDALPEKESLSSYLRACLERLAEGDVGTASYLMVKTKSAGPTFVGPLKDVDFVQENRIHRRRTEQFAIPLARRKILNFDYPAR